MKVWRAAGVSVHTPRRLPVNSIFGKRKSISEQKRIAAVQSRMRIAKNSNFCSTSNRLAILVELMKTKMLDASGFPLTSKDKPSILFEDQIDNHILHVLRIVDFFVVLIVVQDESVYLLVKFFHMFIMQSFFFLVLLQQNQDVDSVVLEHLLHSTRLPKLSRYEFSSSVVAI